MRITFLGAAGQVTGSQFLAEAAGGARLLVDCGLVQGTKSDMLDNFAPFAFDPASLGAALLTHAHIDHSGKLPKLAKDGFRGPIHCTAATADLLPLMLLDSAHIQRMENERFNRKRARRGEPPAPPLYDEADVEATLKLVVPHPYGEPFAVAPGVTAEFRDSGHILGSSFARLVDASGGGKPFAVTFSGDLGNSPVPILRDPEPFGESDLLLLESTYGDRLRDDDGDRAGKLTRIIEETRRRGGKVIAPAFALGRTQELLYEISELIAAGRIAPIPVVVDSPLARGATEVFRRHAECFDGEMRERLARGDDPFHFPGLTITATVEESMAAARSTDPMIILSASGMCTAGRIKHHLRASIFRPENTILFLGYQGRGTLGRQIREGEPTVRIHGQEYAVKARVESIDGFSAHADQRGLVRWATEGRAEPPEIVLVHGEPEPQRVLAGLLRERGAVVHVPRLGDAFEFAPGETTRFLPAEARPPRDEAPEPAPPPQPAATEPPERGRAARKGKRAARGKAAPPAPARPAAAPDPRVAQAVAELRSLRADCESLRRRVDLLLDILDRHR